MAELIIWTHIQRIADIVTFRTSILHPEPIPEHPASIRHGRPATAHHRATENRQQLPVILDSVADMMTILPALAVHIPVDIHLVQVPLALRGQVVPKKLTDFLEISKDLYRPFCQEITDAREIIVNLWKTTNQKGETEKRLLHLLQREPHPQQNLHQVIQMLQNVFIDTYVLGLSKEEEEAAKKKIGWVDENEAEKRIGTGLYEKEKEQKKQEAENASRKSLSQRMSNIEESDDSESEMEFTPAAIMARLTNSNINDYGRDCDKGDIVFLASCQCFRAESSVVRKYSNLLATLMDDHKVNFA